MEATTQNSSRPALGIDIAKKTFDAALLQGAKLSVGHFDNDAKGFVKLSRWVSDQGADQFHACMESTGVYWEPLAVHLHQARQRVSVVNPLRIHGFARTELARNKTDREDAARIARFCHLCSGPLELGTGVSNTRECCRPIERGYDDGETTIVQPAVQDRGGAGSVARSEDAGPDLSGT